MKTKIPIISIVLALVFIIVATSVALANGVELPRWVLGGGATESSGGNIAMRATLGQPSVGGASGGDVTLEHGFWSAGAMDQTIYLPLAIR